MLNKQMALKIVNPAFGLAFLFQALSGFAAGMDSARAEFWGDAHGTCAWVLLALFALHVWLNWGWIKTNMLGFILKKG